MNRRAVSSRFCAVAIAGGGLEDALGAGLDNPPVIALSGDVAERGQIVADGGEHEGGTHRPGAAGEVGDDGGWIETVVAQAADDVVEVGEAGIGVVFLPGLRQRTDIQPTAAHLRLQRGRMLLGDLRRQQDDPRPFAGLDRLAQRRKQTLFQPRHVAGADGEEEGARHGLLHQAPICRIFRVEVATTIVDVHLLCANSHVIANCCALTGCLVFYLVAFCEN